MIKIQQVKIPVQENAQESVLLERKIRKILKLKNDQEFSFQIQKKSIDARKKPDLFWVYEVIVHTSREEQICRYLHLNTVMMAKEKKYRFAVTGNENLKHRPVIVGSGPAGLFCGYELAKAGYAPVILERGSMVEQRSKDVADFWEKGSLKPDSNVQFGEGGAGTFSDGKLNTLVKDPLGRNRHVLELFVAAGAPKEILYESKPHIGTDLLVTVVANLRKEIIRMGGSFCFDTLCSGISIENERIRAVECNHQSKQDTQVLVLATGHSARDTFSMLLEQGLDMEAKAFAVGFRVEHPQSMISQEQYGCGYEKYELEAAPYKVTASSASKRGVYSFCMCPGGYVVNASSEEQGLAVNGMSYYKRDAANANSAIIVSVTPEDYPTDGPLAGIEFQRQLEKKAYELGKGSIPQQLFGDFEKGRPSTSYGTFESCVKGSHVFADLTTLLTEEMNQSFCQGIHDFARHIHGFDREDAILSGVESRTSSPVRIHRNPEFESNIAGIYPCGEGAGYAGGIMSAAMDGIKVAEAIAKKYQPMNCGMEGSIET